MAPQRLFTFVYVVVFLLCAVFVIVRAEMTVKKCFKGTDKEPEGEVTLSCPAGSIISISQALLGKNQWFECVLTDDDCVHSTRIFRECEGLNTCKRTFRTYSARCGYITILMVSFNCVKVTLPITPDPEETTVSPRSPHVSDGQGKEGGDKDDRGMAETDWGNTNTYNKRGKDSTKEEDELEVGLLVATILASLVTGVMLVIAIVMTIRRLLNYPMRLQRSEGENPSSFTLCIERACFHVDKFPCFSGPDSLEGSAEQSLRTRKSTSIRLSCDEITAQNSQRTRMTPIGQEASDGIAQSKDSDDRDEDPEGSDISGLAQTPTDIEADASRSSFKIKQSEVAGVNSNCRRENSLDKTKNWNEKRIRTLKTVNNNNIAESLDLNRSGGVGAFITTNDINDFVTYANSIDPNIETPLQCNKTLDNVDFDKHQSPTDDSAGPGCPLKSKYTAIVVPNTETSSRC